MNIPLAVTPLLVSLPDGGAIQTGVRLEIAFALDDGSPIEASVDTGSAGLQLLADLVPASALAALPPTGTPVMELFPASGIQATGYLAHASFTLGGATTSSPIPIVVFDQFSCVSSVCAGAGPLAPYVFDGLPAVIGLGMRNDPALPLGNPIVQLPGQPSFIIEAPNFGGDAGILRIAPTPDEVAAYQTFQLTADATLPALSNGTAAWNDLGVSACVDDLTRQTNYCAGALLDTGTSFIEIAWTGQNGDAELPPRSNVSVSIGPTANPLGQFSVTVGSPPQFGLDLFVVAPPLQDIGQLLVLGMPVFFRYNVLFDQAKGQIGLLAH
jgi:hypothetical protein